LGELIALQAEFDARHASRIPWNVSVTEYNPEHLEHLLTCLVGELGEFATVVRNVIEGKVLYRDALPSLSEEIADVFIYLIKICYQVGIDLEGTYLERLKFNEERFKKFLR
jgi:NTP pyrophosphatase (non-canonical NTP hydrolase)